MMEISRSLGNRDLLGILCLLIALAFVLRYVLARRNKPLWPITLLLAVIAVVTYFGQMHRPLMIFWERGHWATFHYFMGSKYFDELEYYRLYRYIALAEEELGGNVLDDVNILRHLEDYSLVSKEKAVELARREKDRYFTSERWQEFKRDWAGMQRRAPKERWRDYLTDRGFNPPPFWNVVPGFISKYVRVDDTRRYMLVRNFDLFMLVAALVLTALLCGLDIALIVFCFIMLADYNRGHQLGTYFQFVWLSSMVAAMALYRAGKMKTAGAFWAVSASMRVFPLVLILGLGVAWLRKFIQNRAWPKKETLFLVSFAVFCLIFLAAGLTQGKGVSTTREFLKNITMHGDHQKFDGNKFGLKRSMALDLSEPWRHMGSANRRLVRFENNAMIYRGLWFALMALGLAVMIRKVDDDDWLIPAAVILLFALMVISRYYYLCLIVFLIPPREKKVLGAATLAGAGLFFIHALFYLLPGRFIGNQATFTAANFAYIAFFLVFPTYLLIADLLRKKPALQAD